MSKTIEVTMFEHQEVQIKTALHYLDIGWSGIQSTDTGHYYLMDEQRREVPRIISNGMMNWMLHNGIVEKINGEVKLKDGRPEIKFTKRR